MDILRIIAIDESISKHRLVYHNERGKCWSGSVLTLMILGLVFILVGISRTERSLFLSPIFLYSAVVVFFHIIGSWYINFDEFQSKYPFYDSMHGRGYPSTIAIHLFLLVLGYALIPKSRSKKIEGYNIVCPETLVAVSFFMQLFVFFLGIGLLSGKEGNYVEIGQQLSYSFGLSKNVSPLLCVILLINAWKRKTKTSYLLLFFSYLMTIYIFILQGARIYVLDLLMLSMLVFGVLGLRTRFFGAIFTIFSGILLFSILTYLRSGENTHLVEISSRLFLSESTVINYIFDTFPSSHPYLGFDAFAQQLTGGTQIANQLFRFTRGEVGEAFDEVSNVPPTLVGQIFVGFGYISLPLIFAIGLVFGLISKMLAYKGGKIKITNIIFCSYINFYMVRSSQIGIDPIINKIVYLLVFIILINMYCSLFAPRIWKKKQNPLLSNKEVI